MRLLRPVARLPGLLLASLRLLRRVSTVGLSPFQPFDEGDDSGGDTAAGGGGGGRGFARGGAGGRGRGRFAAATKSSERSSAAAADKPYASL